MKLALLLNVVDSSIGGVLIMGDRGTGKSVAVRSLVDLLPMIDIVQDDPFNSSPTGEASQPADRVVLACFLEHGSLTAMRAVAAVGSCSSLSCLSKLSRHQAWFAPIVWVCPCGPQASALPCCCPGPLILPAFCPPTSADPKQMGPDALQRYAKGEKLPATQMRTPLVELPLGATGACLPAR
jgi:hypothetical protein